ncbi:MAG: hypothetical protein EZS28_010674, partial [Streblomastix strix]
SNVAPAPVKQLSPLIQDLHNIMGNSLNAITDDQKGSGLKSRSNSIIADKQQGQQNKQKQTVNTQLQTGSCLMTLFELSLSLLHDPDQEVRLHVCESSLLDVLARAAGSEWTSLRIIPDLIKMAAQTTSKLGTSKNDNTTNVASQPKSTNVNISQNDPDLDGFSSSSSSSSTSSSPQQSYKMANSQSLSILAQSLQPSVLESLRQRRAALICLSRITHFTDSETRNVKIAPLVKRILSDAKQDLFSGFVISRALGELLYKLIVPSTALQQDGGINQLGQSNIKDDDNDSDSDDEINGINSNGGNNQLSKDRLTNEFQFERGLYGKNDSLVSLTSQKSETSTQGQNVQCKIDHPPSGLVLVQTFLKIIIGASSYPPSNQTPIPYLQHPQLIQFIKLDIAYNLPAIIRWVAFRPKMVQVSGQGQQGNISSLSQNQAVGQLIISRRSSILNQSQSYTPTVSTFSTYSSLTSGPISVTQQLVPISQQALTTVISLLYQLLSDENEYVRKIVASAFHEIAWMIATSLPAPSNQQTQQQQGQQNKDSSKDKDNYKDKDKLEKQDKIPKQLRDSFEKLMLDSSVEVLSSLIPHLIDIIPIFVQGVDNASSTVPLIVRLLSTPQGTGPQQQSSQQGGERESRSSSPSQSHSYQSSLISDPSIQYPLQQTQTQSNQQQSSTISISLAFSATTAAQTLPSMPIIPWRLKGILIAQIVQLFPHFAQFQSICDILPFFVRTLLFDAHPLHPLCAYAIARGLRELRTSKMRSEVVSHLVYGLAHSKQFRHRLAFIDIAEMGMRTLSRRIIRISFMEPLLTMGKDKVGSVRRRIAALLPLLKQALTQNLLAQDTSSSEKLNQLLTELISDPDKSVSETALASSSIIVELEKERIEQMKLLKQQTSNSKDKQESISPQQTSISTDTNKSPEIEDLLSTIDSMFDSDDNYDQQVAPRIFNPLRLFNIQLDERLQQEEDNWERDPITNDKDNKDDKDKGRISPTQAIQEQQFHRIGILFQQAFANRTHVILTSPNSTQLIMSAIQNSSSQRSYHTPQLSSPVISNHLSLQQKGVNGVNGQQIVNTSAIAPQASPLMTLSSRFWNGGSHFSSGIKMTSSISSVIGGQTVQTQTQSQIGQNVSNTTNAQGSNALVNVGQNVYQSTNPGTSPIANSLIGIGNTPRPQHLLLQQLFNQSSNTNTKDKYLQIQVNQNQNLGSTSPHNIINLNLNLNDKLEQKLSPKGGLPPISPNSQSPNKIRNLFHTMPPQSGGLATTMPLQQPLTQQAPSYTTFSTPQSTFQSFSAPISSAPTSFGKAQSLLSQFSAPLQGQKQNILSNQQQSPQQSTLILQTTQQQQQQQSQIQIPFSSSVPMSTGQMSMNVSEQDKQDKPQKQLFQPIIGANMRNSIASNINSQNKSCSNSPSNSPQISTLNKQPSSASQSQHQIGQQQQRFTPSSLTDGKKKEGSNTPSSITHTHDNQQIQQQQSNPNINSQSIPISTPPMQFHKPSSQRVIQGQINSTGTNSPSPVPGQMNHPSRLPPVNEGRNINSIYFGSKRSYSAQQGAFNENGSKITSSISLDNLTITSPTQQIEQSNSLSSSYPSSHSNQISNQINNTNSQPLLNNENMDIQNDRLLSPSQMITSITPNTDQRSNLKGQRSVLLESQQNQYITAPQINFSIPQSKGSITSMLNEQGNKQTNQEQKSPKTKSVVFEQMNQLNDIEEQRGDDSSYLQGKKRMDKNYDRTMEKYNGGKSLLPPLGPIHNISQSDDNDQQDEGSILDNNNNNGSYESNISKSNIDPGNDRNQTPNEVVHNTNTPSTQSINANNSYSTIPQQVQKGEKQIIHKNQNIDVNISTRDRKQMSDIQSAIMIVERERMKDEINKQQGQQQLRGRSKERDSEKDSSISQSSGSREERDKVIKRIPGKQNAVVNKPVIKPKSSDINAIQQQRLQSGNKDKDQRTNVKLSITSTQLSSGKYFDTNNTKYPQAQKYKQQTTVLSDPISYTPPITPQLSIKGKTKNTTNQSMSPSLSPRQSPCNSASKNKNQQKLQGQQQLQSTIMAQLQQFLPDHNQFGQSHIPSNTLPIVSLPSNLGQPATVQQGSNSAVPHAGSQKQGGFHY